MRVGVVRFEHTAAASGNSILWIVEIVMMIGSGGGAGGAGRIARAHTQHTTTHVLELKSEQVLFC